MDEQHISRMECIASCGPPISRNRLNKDEYESINSPNGFLSALGMALERSQGLIASCIPGEASFNFVTLQRKYLVTSSVKPGKIEGNFLCLGENNLVSRVSSSVPWSVRRDPGSEVVMNNL